MTTISLRRSTPEVKDLLSRTYPDYRGLKISLRSAEAYHLGNYWDGGTRNYVVALDLATMAVAPPVSDSTNPFTDTAHATVAIPDGVAFVEHTIFCGKDLGIRIYVNKATFPKMLEFEEAK